MRKSKTTEQAREKRYDLLTGTTNQYLIKGVFSLYAVSTNRAIFQDTVEQQFPRY